MSAAPPVPARGGHRVTVNFGGFFDSLASAECSCGAHASSPLGFASLGYHAAAAPSADRYRGYARGRVRLQQRSTERLRPVWEVSVIVGGVVVDSVDAFSFEDAVAEARRLVTAFDAVAAVGHKFKSYRHLVERAML